MYAKNNYVSPYKILPRKLLWIYIIRIYNLFCVNIIKYGNCLKSNNIITPETTSIRGNQRIIIILWCWKTRTILFYFE